VDCGTQINPERLAALPWATRCISCQRRIETSHTSTGQVGGTRQRGLAA
jgi:RNA polymerase-binding transcription factor DksA